MLNVLTGFAIIFAVISVGWILAKRGIIKPGEQRLMLNEIAFYAATPALIFTSVATAKPEQLTSPVVLVVSTATVITSALFILASRAFFPMDIPRTTAGAAAASYYNSVNIGLPVSLYVLGDATYVVPTLLVQMCVFTPFILVFLGADSGGVAAYGAPTSSATSARGRALASARHALTTPMVIAAAAGVPVSFLGITVPQPIMAPLEILGGASVPLILLSFGASLSAGGLLSQYAPATLTATFLKIMGMPALAYVLAQWWGLDSTGRYAAVVLAAMPTAQNIFNYAATYRRGETIARDTVFLTTFGSLPAMLVIAFLLG